MRQRIEIRGQPQKMLDAGLLMGNKNYTATSGMIDDWNYEKNGDICYLDALQNVNKPVWWICKNCEREWKDSVAGRRHYAACPRCGRKWK